MRKLMTASLLAVTLLLILVAPSDAAGRHRHHWRGGSRVFVGFGFGPAYWYGPYPYWYYPPPYYYTPPPVVVQEPPVYVQQQPAPAAPPPPSGPAEGYWHYCPSAKQYYPDVPTCPEPWIKVPPRQQ